MRLRRRGPHAKNGGSKEMQAAEGESAIALAAASALGEQKTGQAPEIEEALKALTDDLRSSEPGSTDEKDLAALRERLASLEQAAREAGPADETVSKAEAEKREQALDARFTELGAAIEALDGRLKEYREEAVQTDARHVLDAMEERLAAAEQKAADASSQAAPPAKPDESLEKRIAALEQRLAEGAGDENVQLAELRHRFDEFMTRFPETSKVMPLPLPKRKLKLATRLRVLVAVGIVALIAFIPLTFVARDTCNTTGNESSSYSLAFPGSDPPAECSKRESGWELVF